MMKSGFDTFVGGLGCFLSGLGTLWGILLGPEPALIGAMFGGLALMMYALAHDEYLRKKEAERKAMHRPAYRPPVRG